MKWYLLACQLCKPVLTMPFTSAEQRGRWAAAHRDGTGHDTWQVWDEPPGEGQRKVTNE